MTINSQTIQMTLTPKEISVWMAALRLAAKKRTVPIIPWDECPFFKQHGELVKITGYGAGDHEDLREFLRPES